MILTSLYGQFYDEEPRKKSKKSDLRSFLMPVSKVCRSRRGQTYREVGGVRPTENEEVRPTQLPDACLEGLCNAE